MTTISQSERKIDNTGLYWQVKGLCKADGTVVFDVESATADQLKLLSVAASTYVANASVAYADDGTAADLDTDARRVAAMNTTNGKLNSVLACLIAHGLMAAS